MPRAAVRSQTAKVLQDEHEHAHADDETRLRQLGYKQELRRELNLLRNFAVSFGLLSMLTGARRGRRLRRRLHCRAHHGRLCCLGTCLLFSHFFLPLSSFLCRIVRILYYLGIFLSSQLCAARMARSQRAAPPLACPACSAPLPC